MPLGLTDLSIVFLYQCIVKFRCIEAVGTLPSSNLNGIKEIMRVILTNIDNKVRYWHDTRTSQFQVFCNPASHTYWYVDQ